MVDFTSSCVVKLRLHGSRGVGEVKAGSSSAVAFGRVLQAARKRWSKTQADVANFFDPKLSVAAVSMAESGSRPPKTEAMVRGYAAALELDEDALLQLWWAMQGMIGIDIWAEDLPVPNGGANTKRVLRQRSAITKPVATPVAPGPLTRTSTSPHWSCSLSPRRSARS
ncbi:helix-turn-helix transcriptional regulator [Streptomyces globisporus]|uniref:Helix-turn-helix transcriptional regulator n=1 Tax=Streptomyces globisporus TaxID=1908 RepID=A0A927BP56_STRGL|nr:helix-turn-helix transcriptional regulator [Streptomyces globisporus]